MFMLFVYEEYEERGGWNDFVGIFDSVSEAKACEKAERREHARNNGQIVSLETLKVVSKLDIIKDERNTWEHRWTDC